MDILRPKNLAQKSVEVASTSAKVALYGGITLAGFGCKVIGLGGELLELRYRTPEQSSFPDHINAPAVETPLENQNVIQLRQPKA